MSLVRRVFFAAVFCIVFASATCALASIHQGDSGQEVSDVQTKLQALGYSIAVDGSYGPASVSAVRKFQAEHGLEADGVVGQQTFRALLGRDLPVSRGDSSTSYARRLTSTALRYTGTPYVFGGTAPGGFDCSGFVRYIYAQMGIALPRTADAQYECGTRVGYSSLQTGDLVFFETYESGPSHVGIYLGNGQFVHASSSYGVRVDSLGSSYYSSCYLGARRIS